MNKARIPSPFDTTIHSTEWTCAAKVAEWINEIIREKRLDLGLAEVEKKRRHEHRRGDIIITEASDSQQALCVMEFKAPFYDPIDRENLKDPAWKKARDLKAKYFCISNFQWLVWYNTQKVSENVSENEQTHERYHLSEIEDLDAIEEYRFRTSIRKGLERFLEQLYNVHTGKEPAPQKAVDEWLIFALHEKVNTLARYYRDIIQDKFHKDEKFKADLRKWFLEQKWDFAPQDLYFEKAARQAAYLLVNKILFYDALQSQKQHKLSRLEIPEGLTRGGLLRGVLQAFFTDVINNIDYEQIYSTDFIDQEAFPDHKGVVTQIKELVKILDEFDFSTLGYEVVGRIFEQLIPENERHILGQYFTNPDVVDIILRFCLRHEDDKVFDPACGAGTFLVRSYVHKNIMYQYKEHKEILKTLWGTDIAKFPVHLAAINLAINDLRAGQAYPRVVRKDFFDLHPGHIEIPDAWRKVELKGLGKDVKREIVPKYFDCIVGNPPYTRQEEITQIGESEEEYKGDIIEFALKDRGKRIANISKRAGIYAYFFVHGTKFLRNGGRFGFIVSNSWLDVDYGKGLQEFFLKNYKIVAIIESKVERWFRDADINTCIVLLERCTEENVRMENLVRFVHLFKPLRHFIPVAQNMWEKQLHRLNEIDKLLRTVLAHNEFYQNDELRVYPKSQKDLWEEGLEIADEDESGQIPTHSGRQHDAISPTPGDYVGSKWGKYLRAPEVFFTILEKGKDKLVPLKEIANVRRGFTTGANEFFYLTEEQIKQKGIEKEFWMHKENGKWVPNYVIKSPRECQSVFLNPYSLENRVLMIHKDKKDLKGTNVLKYIEEGERKGFHTRPTCSSRGERWYDVGFQQPPDLIWFKAFNDRVLSPVNLDRVFSSDRFYAIYLRNSEHRLKTSAILNSTLSHLFVELWGRVNLGEGALDNMTYEAASMYTIHPKHVPVKIQETLSAKFSKRKIESVFDEIGAFSPSEVCLGKVKPDRRELDKIVMEEILGLTEDEQLEVYRAVVDLVKSRLEKAKSLGKKKKTKEGIDIDALVKIVSEKIRGETLGKFYKEHVLTQKPLSTKTVPRAADGVRIAQELFDWYLYVGKKHIKCSSENEARYLKVWTEARVEKIKIPKDEKALKTIVPKLEKLKADVDGVVNSYLDSIIDAKTREKIAHYVWAELVK